MSESARARYDRSAWVPLFGYLGRQIEVPWGGFVGDDIIALFLELFGERFDSVFKFLSDLWCGVWFFSSL